MAHVIPQTSVHEHDRAPEESKREHVRSAAVAHIGCRVDGIMHVAKLASYIRTWAQLEQVADMWLSDLLSSDSDDDDEWQLAEDRSGALDTSEDTVHFSMKRGTREVAVVLARLAGDL